MGVSVFLVCKGAFVFVIWWYGFMEGEWHLGDCGWRAWRVGGGARCGRGRGLRGVGDFFMGGLA